MTAKSNSRGRDFERRVSNIYRALGADVAHDVRIAGSQVDVLVEETLPTGARIKTAVECKSADNPIGVPVVRGVADAAKTLLDGRHVDLYLIVSESGFTTSARESAASQGIRLVEVADLEAHSPLTAAGVFPGQPDRLAEGSKELLQAASSLPARFSEALDDTQLLTGIEYDALRSESVDVLSRFRSFAELHRDRTAAAPSRRYMASLLRVEEDIERSIDALGHLQRIHDLVTESNEPSLSPIASEADSASARTILLRELHQAKSFFRTRITRLRDTCDRLDWIA